MRVKNRIHFLKFKKEEATQICLTTQIWEREREICVRGEFLIFKFLFVLTFSFAVLMSHLSSHERFSSRL